MGLLNLFKSSASKKGELISDYVILLGGNKDFQELLRCTPKPMSHRLLIDHILVCSAAATYLLFFRYSNDLDYAKQVSASMLKRQIWHLTKMSEDGVKFNIGDVIVDEYEKNMFLQDGWELSGFTTILNIFSVIGDYRTEKYSKAVCAGLIELAEKRDVAKMTAKLIQESKNSCGGLDGFPYLELKLIYDNCISAIMEVVKDKR